MQNGHVRRLTDEDIESLVVEICGNNVSTTFVTCPESPSTSLGLKLPFLNMLVKNLNKYFALEVEILDDTNTRRRFKAATFNSTTKVCPFVCSMPMQLDPGWNRVTFNLADFTLRAYGTHLVETQRVSIHANCRLRRVFFSDNLYSAEEVPPEFRLQVPRRGLTIEEDACLQTEDEPCLNQQHLSEDIDTEEMLSVQTAGSASLPCSPGKRSAMTPSTVASEADYGEEDFGTQSVPTHAAQFAGRRTRFGSPSSHSRNSTTAGSGRRAASASPLVATPTGSPSRGGSRPSQADAISRRPSQPPRSFLPPLPKPTK